MRKNIIRFVIIAAAIVMVPILALTWGDNGHMLINRTAVEKIPADMPQFLKAGESHIVYNGPEPDRWRSNLEKTLAEENAPDHFIDLEYVDWMKQLPEDRYTYIREIYQYKAKHPDADVPGPEKIGFQPYAAIEVFDRLKVAFREYRHAQKAGRSTADAEANALFYAGWLGHYVGDGANPMHTSIQYNGWVGPNPNGYTTSHDIHYKFESGFVNQNLDDLKIDNMVGAPKLLENPFQDYVAYLRQSQSKVEEAYALDKQCAFDGRGTAAGREFVRQRLASGAQMLLNMWYTAWVDSAQEPEPYHPPKSPKHETKPCQPSPGNPPAKDAKTQTR